MKLIWLMALIAFTGLAWAEVDSCTIAAQSAMDASSLLRQNLPSIDARLANMENSSFNQAQFDLDLMKMSEATNKHMEQIIRSERQSILLEMAFVSSLATLSGFAIGKFTDRVI